MENKLDCNRILIFTFRGDTYRVDSNGRINANGLGYYSDTWIFVGGSRHHWSNHVDVSLLAAFEKPELLNGCLGWDVDHGTTRRWGGRDSAGKIPRISGAYVTTDKSSAA